MDHGTAKCVLSVISLLALGFTLGDVVFVELAPDIRLQIGGGVRGAVDADGFFRADQGLIQGLAEHDEGLGPPLYSRPQWGYLGRGR